MKHINPCLTHFRSMQEIPKSNNNFIEDEDKLIDISVTDKIEKEELRYTEKSCNNHKQMKCITRYE